MLPYINQGVVQNRLEMDYDRSSQTVTSLRRRTIL